MSICPYYCLADGKPLCWVDESVCLKNPLKGCCFELEDEEEEEEDNDYANDEI